jgi:flagellar basal-body rod modification protein FlgD
MVDTSVTGGTTAATANANIASQTASLASNYNMFLNLLTTQLQNQDPLNPMDNNEFTQQLTQMTGVQQQLLTNQLLTQMLSQNQAQVSGTAVGLIGKQVTVNTPQTDLTNGSATWNYNLPSNATAMSLSVMDSTGKLVAKAAPADLTPSDFNAGDHTFAWNGKDLNGKALPDGVYTLQINATDGNGNAITASESYSGVVSGLGTASDGTTLLDIGDINGPVSSVTSVKAAPTS